MFRVTQGMIANQVVFNLSQTLARFYKLQNQMSTSRRINQPSDDPIGTMKDLSYRERLSDITQYKSNISMSQVWLKSTDNSLNDVNTAVSSAYETAVAMANDTYDDIARLAAANDVKYLVQQVVEAANTQLHGSYIFSGYRTDTKPFELGALGAVYHGDSGVIEHSIDTRARVQVNMVGSDLFTKPFCVLGEDSDLELGVSTATAIATLNSGAGIDLTDGTFTVLDANHNTKVTIDLNNPSPPTTVGDVLNAINAQLTAGGITNLTAEIGEEGNNIRLVATADPTITTSTPLENLNLGSGVDLDPGQFRIRSEDGSIDQAIDLSGATTVGDVIAAIQTQLGDPNVTVAINSAGTGLEISDANVPPLDLIIEEISADNFTAGNLGIIGRVGASLTGSDLNPLPDFVIDNAPGSSTATDLGIIGSMSYNMVGTDLNPQLELNSELASISNGQGLPGGVIRIVQGESVALIDTSDPSIVTVQDLLDAINNSGLNITASVNAAQTGIQIVNDDPAKTLIVKNEDSIRTASVLNLVGSTDVLGNMILLGDALAENDREVVEDLVGPLDDALNVVLNSRAVAGAKSNRVEVTLNRLESQRLSFTSLLSDVEDAELTEILTDLATQENAYNAALTAAAKIIQPSLLDFIR
jgi:flagellar hook-associated protein 3 FlgL